MKNLIQAAEIWVPDVEGQLLEFGGGLYGSAVEFGAVSRSMCFGRGEGLPGRVWDQARPILLKDLQTGHFRRAAAARKAGLTCAAAFPVYFGDVLKAVVVLFCAEAPEQTGAIELWRNDPRVASDMTLVDGYYGSTGADFAAASHDTYLPRGSGLPGLAWQREASVFLDGLPGSTKFLRAEAAAAAGIERGLALPCPVPGNEHYVLTLLSSASTPIARRLESWVPAADGIPLQRAYGYCESAGALPVGAQVTTSGSGDDSIAAAFASAAPQVRARAGDEPGAVGAAAAAAGLGAMLVLPIASDGAVSEALALYF